MSIFQATKRAEVKKIYLLEIPGLFRINMKDPCLLKCSSMPRIAAALNIDLLQDCVELVNLPLFELNRLRIFFSTRDAGRTWNWYDRWHAWF